MRHTHLSNRWKAQTLLGVFISLSILSVFIWSLDKASETNSGLDSMSTPSYDALTPVSVAVEQTTSSGFDASIANAKRVSVRNTVANACIQSHSVESHCSPGNCVSNIHNVFKKHLQKSYQLLDIPPPSHLLTF
jgi:hypothetical protein